MKFYKKKDYKTSLKVKTSKLMQEDTGQEYVYLVPSNKNYNSIKPNGNFDSNKRADYFIGSGSNYDGVIKVFKNGIFAQFRDGCFYEYVGKIAI